MIESPQAYIDSIEGPGKAWLEEFHEYMRTRYPDIQPTMFRQRPMFKVGKSYVMFTVAQKNFTVHTFNFDLIEQWKEKFPKASFGKGSIQVKFTDTEAKPVLRAFCDEVIRLNRLENPPPVDVVPALPYAENLTNAFKGSKAKWLPLYEALRDMAREKLPTFVEYFPALHVRWKHGSTFAEISAVAAAMRVEFYADQPHPEYGAVKTVRLSAHRVAHTVELVDAGRFPEVLTWVAASYALTQGNRT